VILIQLRKKFPRTDGFAERARLQCDRGKRFCNSTKNIRKADKKIVCLTFDDGYSNNYKYCLPELEKYNFKATFYITTSLIDSDFGFTEAQIRVLSEKDMEIGSHTVNHVFLSNLSDNKLSYELKNPKVSSKILFENL